MEQQARPQDASDAVAKGVADDSDVPMSAPTRSVRGSERYSNGQQPGVVLAVAVAGEGDADAGGCDDGASVMATTEGK